MSFILTVTELVFTASITSSQLNTPNTENDFDDDLIDHQITAAVGEQLRTDYEVHEFFSEDPSEVTEEPSQVRDKPTFLSQLTG